METSTTATETHACGYRFNFGRAIWAGFVATLLIEILIYLQGQNPALTLGKMILGPDAISIYMYLAGGAFCLLVGILFALLFALIVAPMRFMSDFVQSILFATILTLVAIFTFPKLQTIFDTVMKRETVLTAVQLHNESTEIANINEKAQVEELEKKVSQSNGQDKKKELLYSFMNHLIFALSIVVIYRQCRKYVND